jgi:hypothetical protein
VASGEWWEDHDLVFASPCGAPLDPDRHTKTWNALLARAGEAGALARRPAHGRDLAARPGRRLPDDDGADGVVAHLDDRRYQHVVPELRRAAAERMGEVLWPTATKTATTGQPTPDAKKALTA